MNLVDRIASRIADVEGTSLIAGKTWTAMHEVRRKRYRDAARSVLELVAADLMDFDRAGALTSSSSPDASEPASSAPPVEESSRVESLLAEQRCGSADPSSLKAGVADATAPAKGRRAA